jgi:hypothetical protein
VTVSATRSETPTARTYVTASGLKNAPVRPVRKKTGVIAATMISVAYTMALRTSSDASSTTLASGFGLPARRFSRR